MKIVILHGSAHRNGTTEALAKAFARGARDGGHEVELVELREKDVHDCLGCGACQRNGGHCVQRDDMTALYDQLLTADGIVLASPVYYYTWTSLMKRTLDRTFAIQDQLKDKTFCLLSAGAAPEEQYMQTMFDCYHQYLDCFRAGGNRDGGMLMAYGMNTPEDLKNADYEQRAYEMGRGMFDNLRK